MRTTRAILEEMRLLRDDLVDVQRSWLESSRRQEIVLTELTGAVRDLREESRAHTRAIFALIDRLEGGAAPG